MHARLRCECGGDVQYSGRHPVVVDPAHYRGCVIVERVGDAYRIQRDDGSTMIVDADRLRGYAMRQRDLLDPQRFEVMDFGRKRGDAALSIRMEPYRCAVDLKVVDAFGDDLPRARVRLGDHDLGTRRGVLDLGPNGAVSSPEEE